MTIEIIADHRENKKLHAYFKQKDDKIKFETLEFGDFHFVKDGKVVFIIERKAINDLLQSLNDGRYRKQKVNLFKTGIDFGYLIEGQLSDNDKVYGSIVNMTMRDNIKCFKTANIPETYRMIKKIQKNYEKCMKNKDKYKRGVEITDIVKFSKKEMSSPDNIYICQLMQIPKISKRIAKHITEKYPSMTDLCTKVEFKVLSEIKIKNESSGKERKLGKVTARNIINALKLNK